MAERYAPMHATVIALDKALELIAELDDLAELDVEDLKALVLIALWLLDVAGGEIELRDLRIGLTLEPWPQAEPEPPKNVPKR